MTRHDLDYTEVTWSRTFNEEVEFAVFSGHGTAAYRQHGAARVTEVSWNSKGVGYLIFKNVGDLSDGLTLSIRLRAENQFGQLMQKWVSRVQLKARPVAGRVVPMVCIPAIGEWQRV